jgi:hypothetical protein
MMDQRQQRGNNQEWGNDPAAKMDAGKDNSLIAGSQPWMIARKPTWRMA